MKPRQTQSRHSKQAAMAVYHAMAMQKKLLAQTNYPTISERNRAAAEAEVAWNELVYCRDATQNFIYFERMWRNTTTAVCLLAQGQKTYFTDILAAAEAALQAEPAARNQSPNQRRTLLRPLQDLIDIVHGITSRLSENVLFEIARYGTGCHIRHAAINFLELPPYLRQSTLAIINGTSLRQLAKQHGQKEDKLRNEILFAAKFIYRIAECDSDSVGIQPANSIPELRHPLYRQWGDVHTIINADRNATLITERFEQTVGFGYTGNYNKRMQSIIKTLVKELK